MEYAYVVLLYKPGNGRDTRIIGIASNADKAETMIRHDAWIYNHKLGENGIMRHGAGDKQLAAAVVKDDVSIMEWPCYYAEWRKVDEWIS